MRLRELKKLVEDLVAGGDGGGSALQTIELASQVVAHGGPPFLSEELELGYGKIYLVHLNIGTMPKAITSGTVYAGPYTENSSLVELLTGYGVPDQSITEFDGGAFAKGFNDVDSPYGASWLIHTLDVGATLQLRYFNGGAQDVTFLNSVLTVKEL